MKLDKLPDLYPNKETVTFAGQEFPVERPRILTVSDIRPGDRVFISTESGNRYMLRRSKSAGGAIKIYNERTGGFKHGDELSATGEIAKVGAGFNFITQISPGKETEYNATMVTAIEIRRGFDAAIENMSQEHFSEKVIEKAKGKKPD